MDKVTIKIDENRITLDDVIRLEEGDTSTRFLRDLFSRFLVDENGEYLPDVEAVRAMGRFNVGQTLEIKDAFMAYLGGLREKAVPPEQSSG